MENKLNDLTATEWMKSTKSIWLEDESLSRSIADVALRFHRWVDEQGDKDELLERFGQKLPSVLLSTPPQRDELKIQHPATFAESDVEKLIQFFTKRDELVLDPFLGSGSTCIAAMMSGRRSVGIELVGKWFKIAQERINRYRYSVQLPLLSNTGDCQTLPPEAKVLQGDARLILQDFASESVDFMVTSPPYWSILGKKADHKVKAERLNKNLPTKYSEQEEDIGNIADYNEFIASIGKVMH